MYNAHLKKSTCYKTTLFDIINEVKDIEYNKKVPTVKINDKKCGNCEYKNICLKE